MRRWALLWALLLVIAGFAEALAQAAPADLAPRFGPAAPADFPVLQDDDDDDDDDDDEEDDDDDDHEEDDDYDDETYDQQYSFYGQVRWSGRRTIVGNRELVGDDPWLRFLAPGMRLEVKGEVKGGRILVAEIEVKHPRSWSFYEGPARAIGMEGGWIRAWLAGASGRELFKLLPAEDDAHPPVLVACYERGAWTSVPLGLRPAVAPRDDGWWQLSGRIQEGRIAWSLERPLPGDCD